MTYTPPGWYPDPQQPNTQRYWNGEAWTPQTAPLHPPARPNRVATAALVLGIIGIVLIPIPFFIGFVFGGIPGLLAVILGIVGLGRSASARSGFGSALAGLILGGLVLLAIPLGGGILW
jgi:hypothetical protein